MLRHAPLTTLLLLTCSVVQARTHDERLDPPTGPTSKEVAEAWFRSVAQGDVDEAMELSRVPFLWDGTEEIDEVLDLRYRYEDVLERRGPRDMRPERVERLRPGSAEEHSRYCGRRSGEIWLMWIKQDNVGVCVDDGRVVGFED